MNNQNFKTGPDNESLEYYSYARKEIFPLLPENVTRIFEIGCGAGATIAEIRKIRFIEFAVGIDIFEEAIEESKRHIDLALVGDIEVQELPDEIRDIDVVLCLDILEHLKDPWRVVKTLHERLSDRGVIIASLPNVRHFSVSLPLLFQGKWDLKEAGILDRTHLRFFVKKTAIELMTSSGLELQEVLTTGLDSGRKSALANKLTLGLFRPIFEYQYLVRVGRKNSTC